MHRQSSPSPRKRTNARGDSIQLENRRAGRWLFHAVEKSFRANVMANRGAAAKKVKPWVVGSCRKFGIAGQDGDCALVPVLRRVVICTPYSVAV